MLVRMFFFFFFLVNENQNNINLRKYIYTTIFFCCWSLAEYKLLYLLQKKILYKSHGTDLQVIIIESDIFNKILYKNLINIRQNYPFT